MEGVETNDTIGPKILYPSGHEKILDPLSGEAEYIAAPAIQIKYFVEPIS